MPEPKKTKGGGKDDGSTPKKPTPEEMAKLAEEQPMSGLIPAMIEQDRLDGRPEDHQPYREPEGDHDTDDPSRSDEDQVPENDLFIDRDTDGTFEGEVSNPGTGTDEDVSPELAAPMVPEASSDKNTSRQPDEAELTEFVELIAKAERAGDNDRLAAGSRIFSRFFGNDISLMTSRNPRKVTSFAMLVSDPRNRAEESTLRGWVHGAYVHDDLRTAHVSVDPPLTLTVYSLLFRLKDPKVWRDIAPKVAGKTVSKAKEYINARTGKKKTESVSDMILRQLKNPLRAMQDEELRSLITNPDLLAARLDEDEVHRILGEFGNIRKPVENFLALVSTFRSILTKLNGSRAT